MTEENTSRFGIFRRGLSKTRKSMFGRIANVLGVSEIDEDTWDDLEATLIQADIGVESAANIVEHLQEVVDREGITRTDDLNDHLRAELAGLLQTPPPVNIDGDPTVILMVGVNGAGKTTTTAKLATSFKQQGHDVVLAACDTFRAAAVEQLQIWGERTDTPVIAGAKNADPSAVLFDAIRAAKARGATLVIGDTAGRLHTKYNLMEELRKIYRVAGKAADNAPHHVWLVLDAITGQNALIQAKAFKEAANVTGVIITKLDSTAKGGMVFAVERELGIPVYYLGLGEKEEDLQQFTPEAFIDGLITTD